MAPEAIAADHVYRQLKSDIMAGVYAPSAALNVHQLAIGLGTSISPVRDAMERLVGERLLAVRIAGGFQMPSVTEAWLRDLYSWHGHLARSAVRTGATITLPDSLLQAVEHHRWSDDEAILSATVEYFHALGLAAGNGEHRLALLAAGERLRAARLREGRYIRDRSLELERLVTRSTPGRESALRDALGVYHRRRLRHAWEISEALYRPTSP